MTKTIKIEEIRREGFVRLCCMKKEIDKNPNHNITIDVITYDGTNVCGSMGFKLHSRSASSSKDRKELLVKIFEEIGEYIW